MWCGGRGATSKTKHTIGECAAIEMNVYEQWIRGAVFVIHISSGPFIGEYTVDRLVF